MRLPAPKALQNIGFFNLDFFVFNKVFSCLTSPSSTCKLEKDTVDEFSTAPPVAAVGVELFVAGAVGEVLVLVLLLTSGVLLATAEVLLTGLAGTFCWLALRGLFRVRERLFSRLDNVLFILMEAIVILDNLNLNLSKLVF